MVNRSAADIMIPIANYPTVPHWCTLRQAAHELIERMIPDQRGRMSPPRVVLVFDKNNRLLGQVRRRDVLRGLEPGYLVSHEAHHPKSLFEIRPDPHLSDLMNARSESTIRHQAERPVREVMQPLDASVDITDSLATVMNVMEEHDQSIIPVMDKKKVVGVIRSVDVLNEVDRFLTGGSSE